MTIKQMGNNWLVLSKRTGEVLGVHTTYLKALKQLRAVEISKSRSSGKKIIRRK